MFLIDAFFKLLNLLNKVNEKVEQLNPEPLKWKFTAEETLIKLEHEPFEQLQKEGELDYPVLGQLKRIKQGIVYDGSKSDFDFVYEPAKDLDIFLEYSRLVVASEEPAEKIILEQNISLRELLKQQFSELVLLAKPVKFEKLIRSEDLFFRDRSFLFLGGLLLGEAKESLIKSGSFYGQLGICSCESAGCSSSYAWFENNVCIFLGVYGDCSLYTVELFPFRIEYS